MRTIFFGTPDFALASLAACRESSELLAVVTQPDRPRGRGQKLSPCAVRAQALEWGLPVFSPASLKKPSALLQAFEDLVEQTRPELFVVTAYGNLLPQRILDLPRLGAINVHASLLPRWRGAAPIQRAIEAEDGETGVCLQKMVMELDAGDVLAELRCPVGPDESAISLSARLSEMGGSLLGTFLRSPSWEGRPQDAARVTHAAKIQKDEGLWRPEWSARQTHAKVRAFAAWPGVRARLAASPTELKLIETRIFARANLRGSPAPAGTLLLEEGRVFLESGVRTGEDLVELLKIQVPGKGPVRAWDYFQNLSAQPRLEPA